MKKLIHHTKLLLTKYSNTKKLYFYITSFLFLFIFLISIIVTNGYSLKLILTGFDNDTFMDFYNMLRVNRIETISTRYQSGTIYPPLANLCYLIMNLALPKSISSNFQINQYAMIVFFLYSVLLIFLFSITVLSLKKGTLQERYCFLGILLFSIPFIYVYERANIIFLALIFTMFFFLWKDSKNKVLQEISYICLAMAAGIKIYPAIFGFLLVKEGKIKESIRLIIYGILSFLVPFLIYGQSNISTLIHNLTTASSNFAQGRIGLKLAFSETIAFLCDILHLQRYQNALYSIIFIIILISSIISFIFLKKKWQEILLLTCLLIGIPKISAVYSGIFLVLPLIYLIDCKEKEKTNYLYLTLIMLCMLPLPFAFTEGLGIPMYSSMFRTIHINIQSFSILIITILLITSGLKNLYAALKQKQKIYGIVLFSTYIICYSGIMLYKQSSLPYLANNFIRYVANDSFSLSENNSCTQVFVPKEDSISSITIRLGSINANNIILDLKENNTGKVIYTKEIEKSSLCQYSINEISLSSVEVKSGTPYSFIIRTKDGGDNAITIYHTVESYVSADSYAMINYQKMNYSLAINTYEN